MEYLDIEARVEGMRHGATFASQLLGGTPGGIWKCRLVARVSSPAGTYEAMTADFLKMDAHPIDDLSPHDLKNALRLLNEMDAEIINQGFEPLPKGPYWYSRHYRRPYEPEQTGPPTQRDLLEEASRLRAAHQTSQAIDLYTAVLAQDPECREAYLSRADLFRVSGEERKALQDCQHVFPLNHGQDQIAESLLIRAAVYEALEEYSAALNDCHNIRKAHLNSYAEKVLHAITAHCKHKMGDPKGALSEYGRAIKIDPDDMDLRLGRSEVYLSLGKMTDALIDCQYVTLRHPENDRAQRQLKRVKSKSPTPG
ncbi:tetratricopeptide repeat protein [Streptomyces sp. CG4]|uniref:tetratricopeptide repeat protein n=1 Tax=Streptomyces sp. CG4 TaxID=408783 RepID=UPI0034E2EE97